MYCAVAANKPALRLKGLLYCTRFFYHLNLFLNEPLRSYFYSVGQLHRRCWFNIGFAARLAGHWSNGHFIAVVLHLGWTYIVGLLFVNLYFYIFNQQRFRAGRAMNSSPAASPARWQQPYSTVIWYETKNIYYHIWSVAIMVSSFLD